MKKIFWSALMLVLLLVFVLPSVASAAEIVAEGECGMMGDNLTWELDSDGTLTIRGSGAMADYIGNFEHSGAPWWEYAASVRALVLEEGVSAVSRGAFHGCDALETVSFPSSLTDIGFYAFKNCTGLSGPLTIPEGVQTIGCEAFLGCSGFDSALTLPDTLKVIDEYAFYDCVGLSGDLVIPDGVTELGNFAFGNCTGFTGDLVIGDGVTELPGFPGSAGAFHGCSGFAGSLILGGGMERVDGELLPNTFRGSLVLSEGIASVGGFWDVPFTGQLILPESLTAIEGYAFKGCTGLSGSLTLPDGVDTLEGCAFEGCTGLTEVSIPGTVAVIGSECFSGCTGLKKVSFHIGTTTIGWGSFENCGLEGHVVLPPTLQKIDYNAFRNCGKLNAISIPGGVEMKSDIFRWNEGMADIYYGGIESEWKKWDPYKQKFGATDAALHFNSYSAGDLVIQGRTHHINAEETLTLTALYSTMEDISEAAQQIVWTVSAPDILRLDSTSYTISGDVATLSATFTGMAHGPVTVSVRGMEGTQDATSVMVSDIKSLMIQDKPEDTPWLVRLDGTTVVTAQYYTSRSAENEVGEIRWELSEPGTVTILDTTCTLGEDGHSAVVTATLQGLDYGDAVLSVTGAGEAADSVDVRVPVTVIHLLSKQDDPVPEQDEPAGVIAPAGEVFSVFAAYDTAGSVAEELEELEWIIGDESVLEQVGATSWFTRSDGVVIVTADFLAKTPEESTLILKRGEMAQDVCVVQPFFDVARYRADRFQKAGGSDLELLTGFLELDSPCEIFAGELQKNGFEELAAAWETLDLMIHLEPSKVADYVLEPKDVYSAILLNMLEAASETALRNDGLADAKVFSKFMGEAARVAGSVEKFDDLTQVQQDKLLYVLNASLLGGFDVDTLEKVKADAAFTQRLLVGADVFLSSSATVLEGVDTYLNAMAIARMSDGLLAVVEEMYELCPYDAMYLKEALADCVTIVHSSHEELMEQVCSGTLIAAGLNGAERILDTFWDRMVSQSIQELFPALGTLKLAAKGAQVATNILVNTDGITDQYVQLLAMLEIEKLAEQALRSLGTQNVQDPTDSGADAFLAAVDLMFVLRDQDCLKAAEFVDALDDSLVGVISAAMGGGHEDVKTTLENFRKDYATQRVSARTNWIHTLGEDYPGTSLEEYYEPEFWAGVEALWGTDFTIACPVNVYVCEWDDTVVAGVVGGVPFSHSEYISVATDGERKWISIANSSDYFVRCEGLDDGTMDIIAEQYQEGERIGRVDFVDVPLFAGSDHWVYEDSVYDPAEDDFFFGDYASWSEEYLTRYFLSAHSALISSENGAAVEGWYGVSVPLTVTAFVPEGFVFAGWDSSLGKEIFEDPAMVSTVLRMPESDVEIYPCFVALPNEENASVGGSRQEGGLQAVVENHSGQPLEGMLMLAVYTGHGRMKDVHLQSIRVDGENDTIFFECEWAAGDTAKLFLARAKSGQLLPGIVSDPIES